jgi:hypothetical protein
MPESDQIIRIVSVDAPTEDTPSLKAEADLVALALKNQKTKVQMERVAEVHRRYRMVGGQDR